MDSVFWIQYEFFFKGAIMRHISTTSLKQYAFCKIVAAFHGCSLKLKLKWSIKMSMMGTVFSSVG